jgi:hypothetical protein
MTIDEKIRLGMIALTAVSTAIVAIHFGGHVDFKHPLLDALGGLGST